MPQHVNGLSRRLKKVVFRPASRPQQTYEESGFYTSVKFSEWTVPQITGLRSSIQRPAEMADASNTGDPSCNRTPRGKQNNIKHQRNCTSVRADGRCKHLDRHRQCGRCRQTDRQTETASVVDAHNRPRSEHLSNHPFNWIKCSSMAQCAGYTRSESSLITVPATISVYFLFHLGCG